MDDLKIPATVNLGREELADVLCNALEGGSTYWLTAISPLRWPEDCEWAHECIAHGSGFTFSLDDEDGQYVTPSGDEQLQRGLATLAVKYPRHFEDIMNHNDDAETADVLLQCIIFNEVVYG